MMPRPAGKFRQGSVGAGVVGADVLGKLQAVFLVPAVIAQVVPQRRPRPRGSGTQFAVGSGEGVSVVNIAHPLHWTGILCLFLNFVVLALSYFLLPRGRTVAISFLMLELGVAYYAFMPIVSDLRNPPMNWGYPRTWEGFQHAISRGQYEKISPADTFSLQFIKQLGAYMKDLREQFTLLAAPLGFLPFVMWEIKIGARRLKALYVGIALTVFGVIMAVADRFVTGSVESAILDSVFRFLFAGTFVLLTVGGVRWQHPVVKTQRSALNAGLPLFNQGLATLLGRLVAREAFGSCYFLIPARWQAVTAR
jgi:hypothetical protein